MLNLKTLRQNKHKNIDIDIWLAIKAEIGQIPMNIYSILIISEFLIFFIFTFLPYGYFPVVYSWDISCLAVFNSEI